MTHDELYDLLPLHALHALESTEAGILDDHLDGCDRCRAEIDRMRHTAASLVPDAPAPAAVWSRILVEIGSESESPSPAPIQLRPNRNIWMWQTVAAVAAVLILLLGGVAVFQRALIGDLTGDRAIVAAAERALEEPGTYSEDFLVEGSPVARLVLTADGRGFILPTESLPALSVDRAYQLWVINAGGEVISAGVLGSEPAPATFTWTGPVSGFALTREVAGGVISSAGDVVAVIADA
jgi:anti-sigma-K factor RskA